MFSSLARSTLCRRSAKLTFANRPFHASTIDLRKLNVEDLAERVDLDGQNVLMRVDLNVPLSKEVSLLVSLSEEGRHFMHFVFSISMFVWRVRVYVHMK